MDLIMIVGYSYLLFANSQPRFHGFVPKLYLQ